MILTLPHPTSAQSSLAHPTPLFYRHIPQVPWSSPRLVFQCGLVLRSLDANAGTTTLAGSCTMWVGLGRPLPPRQRAIASSLQSTAKVVSLTPRLGQTKNVVRLISFHFYNRTLQRCPFAQCHKHPSYFSSPQRIQLACNTCR